MLLMCESIKPLSEIDASANDLYDHAYDNDSDHCWKILRFTNVLFVHDLLFLANVGE